ncbi:hypothetical protein Poly30_43480 [Planctomycetes bacterium Poly30]|uniref:Uncharacterized protein n=1 Tax=Saltatorellus ferox TaxID=2528018 RepID=A0A518EXI6_9BACT|nr:hypothetical protein Poly30_43480 [Planctomycetes bacterium Poly30]
MSQHHATHRSVDLPAPLTEDASPQEVAECKALPVARRRELLEQWKGDEQAHLRAQNEGMTAKGDEAEHPNATSAGTLQEIVDALASLPSSDSETS